MRFSVTRLACNSLILGGLLSPVVAETSQERVALSLSGPDCVSHRPSIVAALVRIPGVNHVDVESVPDHALVDVVQPGVTPESLATAAHGVASSRQCSVSIMKSCISAAPSPPHP